MKYFEDGDLTVGIQVATKMPELDDLVGDWHIVWGHIDSSERDTDYDEPNALNNMSLKIHRLEPADKRRKSGPEDDNIQLDFNFLKWGLTYQGRYGDKAPVSNLRLVTNTTPSLVDADDDAVILPAQVRDDQDMPFLSVATSAIDRRQVGDKPRDVYQNMEFVAKKTDKTGRCPLELTRNERLRLGDKMDDDGVFEGLSGGRVDVEQLLQQPRRPGETNWQISEKCTKLMKELNRLTDARKRVREQIGMVKQRMYEDLNEAAISPPGSPPLKIRGSGAVAAARSAGGGAGGVKRTSSGTAKAGSGRSPTKRGSRGGSRRGSGRRKSGSIRRPAPPPPPSHVHVNGNNIGDSEDVDEEELEEESDLGSDIEDEEIDDTYGGAIGVIHNGTGVNGLTPSDTATGMTGIIADLADLAAREGLSVEEFQYKMKQCVLCDTYVTRRNWGVHVNTLKHQNNVKEGVTTRIGAGSTPGSTARKRASGVVGGSGGRASSGGGRGGIVIDDDDDGIVATSPPSKRRAVGQGSPQDGRLKRPSAIALKRDGLVNGVRDASTPGSA